MGTGNLSVLAVIVLPALAGCLGAAVDPTVPAEVFPPPLLPSL